MQSTQHISSNDPDKGDTPTVDPLFIELRAVLQEHADFVVRKRTRLGTAGD